MKLRAEYDQLLGVERPRIVEIVSWAAGNGDRSENGDYLYGRKRMRDRRPAEAAVQEDEGRQIVDARAQPDKSCVFGATVTIADEDDTSARSRWSAMTSRTWARAGSAGRRHGDALRGAAIGDLRRVPVARREKEWGVDIRYPDREAASRASANRIDTYQVGETFAFCLIAGRTGGGAIEGEKLC